MALRHDRGQHLSEEHRDRAARRSLGRFPGMTMLAPRFSPDGSKVVFSVDSDGETNIYMMDLDSHASHRLTDEPAIDTSPSLFARRRARSSSTPIAAARQKST